MKTRKSIIISIAILAFILVLTIPAKSQNSLYQDVKANQVGDIITVVLMENISGRSASDARNSTNANGSASGTASGNFIPFEPAFGAGVQVDYGSDERNQASQQQLLEGYMSVQIIEVTASGDMIVEGNRITEINGELHEMNLTGIVRQRDIDSRNRVPSYRVANADISYQKKGVVRELTKSRGFLRRVVYTGVGLALGAAIIIKELN